MSSSGEAVPAGSVPAGSEPGSPWKAEAWLPQATQQPTQQPAPTPTPSPVRKRSRSVVGMAALGLAVLGLIVEVIAIAIAASASATVTTWAVASVLAWIANGLTLAAVVTGVVAVVARLGRWWGAPAIVVGLLANPWLQVTVLGALG